MSVTARLIFFAIAAGSSSRLIVPASPSDLLIFAVGSCRSSTFAVCLRDERVGHDEGLAVAGVEPLREVAGELEVLALVLADRDVIGLVQQDVRGLQDRDR